MLIWMMIMMIIGNYFQIICTVLKYVVVMVDLKMWNDMICNFYFFAVCTCIVTLRLLSICLDRLN